MLNSIIILLFMTNIFLYSLKYIFILFVAELFLNIIINKKILNNIKKIKFLGYIYIFTLIFYIITKQEGEVIWKVFNIYVTKDALVSFSINFLRIINMIMLSWLIKENGIVTNKFGRYKRIIEKVIDLVPEVFNLMKRRLKFKPFLKTILTRINEKNI